MNLPSKTKQRTSIEQIRENDFEAISEYYTTGNSSTLTEQQQRILERLRTAHAVMRKYPRKSVAALKLQARFPEISREQAYCDIRNACRLWNKYDPVDRDFLEGWFLDSNFTKLAEKIPSTAQGNQRYYARWESGYSITYVNDGKYQRPTQRNPTYRYADSSTFVLKEPTMDGYTFEGWYTDSTFKTRVTELVQGNKDDIVLIAKWNDGKVSIRKTLAPTPLKMERVRKYDIKGRSPKARPNYGVYF